MRNHSLKLQASWYSWRRYTAAITALALLLTQLPIVTSAATPTPASEVPVIAREAGAQSTAQRVPPNRERPRVSPPALRVAFAEAPSTRDISRARLFGEALVPVGREPTADETAALARVLERFAAAETAASRVALLEAYVVASTSSPWYASVAGQLGTVYEQEGYFTRASATWAKAWEASHHAQDAQSRAVADYALGEWLEQAALFGKIGALDERLAEVADRDIHGAAAAKVAAARTALWGLTNHHEYAIFSGPSALRQYLDSTGRTTAKTSRTIQAYHPPASGTSLAALRDLAADADADLEMRYGREISTLPVPAIVHLRSDHYSAVVSKGARGFLLRDLVLGGEFWMTAEALADEASGYILIPRGVQTPEWRPVMDNEAATVVGHCAWGAPNLDEPCGCGPGGNGPGGNGPGGNGPGGNGPAGSGPGGNGPGPNGPGPEGPGPDGPPCGVGMPVYRLHPMSAAVMIWDTPVGYTPPRGPAVNFQLTYNHRIDRGAQIPNYGHVGSHWTMDWTSWVWENGGGEIPAVMLRGQGTEWHVTSPHWRSRATLVKVAEDPVRYERRLPNGSVEVFEQPDRAAGLPGRRVFLTEIIDPAGQSLHFSYDQDLRLVAVVDALGQVTTVEYAAANPLLVSRVTDPFGRSAVLTYDSSGRLDTVTDTIGMSSRFVYGLGDFITAMTTPYGSTNFRKGDTYLVAYPLAIEAVDATGATERVEFHWSLPSLPATVPANEVPSGFEPYNAALNLSLSVYWDKRAMALYPGDLTKATITNWLIRADICCGGGYQVVRNIPHSVKRPLESRVWYDYPNRASGFLNALVGTSPTQIARVLDDGTTQRWQTTYNDKGMITARIDPLGRQTTYTYAPNGIDLLEISQLTTNGTDLLAIYGNYNAQHVPSTVTDAAGQTTHITYNTAAQPLIVTNAKNETTTYVYNGDGYLETVTGSVAGSTQTLRYDSQGRIATMVDVDGYSITLTYDQLDRPTRVAYPDGTFDETTYDKLNIATRRDRAGRITRYFYDAVGRPIAVRDPLGRMTRMEWCGCGSLQALFDGKGQRTSWTRDAQSRVISATGADGVTPIVYTYDGSGRLKTVTDAKGQITTHTYGVDNSLLQMSFTNAIEPTSPIVFSYDSSFLRAVSMTDAAGVTTFGYKAVGSLGAMQIASVDGPLANDVVFYSYDELGRTTRRQLGGSETTTTYDGLGRVSGLTDAIGTFTYEFSGQTSRVRTITYPNQQVSYYTYFGDANDRRLETIHHTGPGGVTLSKFDYTYDAVGNVVTWRQARVGQTPFLYALEYNDADQLVRAVKQSADPSPNVLRRQAWLYDPAGNRTMDQTDDTVFATTHDQLNRIVARQPGGALTVAGTLDEPGTVAVSGRVANGAGTSGFVGAIDVASGTVEFSVVASDASGNQSTRQFEVDVVGAAANYTYDANGNLTSDGIKTYTWNALDELTRVSEGANELASFVYDGLGRRVQKSTSGTTRTYVYDGANIVEERVSTGEVIRYVNGPGIDNLLARTTNGSVTTFMLTDHARSVIQESNLIGQVVLDREYDAWGNLLQGTSTSGRAYIGREWDAETQLHYFRARYYSANSGRFISEDPIGHTGGLNGFSYVDSRPVVLTDRFGLSADGTAGPPPIPLPPGLNGEPNRWITGPGSPSRPIRWGPRHPVRNPGGGQPNASWDPVNNHWDYNDGRGNRTRYTVNGQRVDHNNRPLIPPGGFWINPNWFTPFIIVNPCLLNPSMPGCGRTPSCPST